LSALLGDTQSAVAETTAELSAKAPALAALKEDLERSAKKREELNEACTALASSASTLIDRFLKDLAEYSPGVIWDNAGAALSALFGETANAVAAWTAEKDADAAALTALETGWDAARKNQADGSAELAKAKGAKAERERHEQERRKRREETRNLFLDAIAENGFETEAAYASSLIPEDELAAIGKRLADYEENGRRIRRDVERLTRETEGKEKPDAETLRCDFDAIKSASDALRAERDETRLRLDNKLRVLKELKKSAGALAKIEREYAAVKSLSDVASGKLDFETYAQTAYFARVLQAANLRLKVMSQNRYVLLRREEAGGGNRRTGLEIEVADSYTGKSRSANSLSGGESFMASLSLALGLSDVVRQTAGGVHLDAMFIDEGFGSLDAEVLELSVRTLSDMADGNRIIGIISHIAELRERIDKQIRVEKTPAGSKIHIVV
jgi:exonuclease SbcC